MRLGLVAWMLSGVAAAQTSPLIPVKFFPLKEDGLAIRRHVEAGKPFTVAGLQGVVAGQQEGGFEAWILPVKVLSNFSIRAEVDGYPVPIDLKPHAAEIEVFPDHTTITYSHIAFTVRQVIFTPDASEDGTGAVVLFQIDAARPVELTFSFTPDVRPMWPQPGQGVPSAEWVQRERSGFYVLHTDFANLAAAVAMPNTRPGIMAPYQEKPHFYPLELKLRYEPKRDGNRYFPLLMAVGTTSATATRAALEAKIDRLNQSIEKTYDAHRERYEHLLEQVTAIHTPDEGLNEDFAWAALSIEQLRAKAQPGGETGLVAGYYSSGDSARPGFGWFFGRDALYTLYAVNGFGDFALSREELEFLVRRQRDDGKMMHEYSQTAAFVDWRSLPYLYAAADATPLFLMAMLDYVQNSGDLKFLNAHRDAVEKAWRFETTHDSDGDGIYDNSQGTGWVESWPPGMPHQEIYLALLDRQASIAMAKLASLMDDTNTAQAAGKRAETIGARIEEEYYQSAKDAYAFSRNSDGSVDKTETVYPMIAWWGGGQGLAHADASFSRWASHDFSTDWGLRDIAQSDPLYDPISYHQGSVWPLFTGWASVAEYRTGHVLSGYAHLMQNADQTTTQDLGAVTELLSGDYFQPFGRSTSHQLWSSAMVIIPALRGLFGIEVDGLSHAVRLAPHLPADWDHAVVDRLHVGDSVCSLEYARMGGKLLVRVKTTSGPAVHLTDGHTASSASGGSAVELNLPRVEVTIPHELPLPGSRTAQMKVLNERGEGRSLTLELEGAGGSTVTLKLRRNQPKLNLHVQGGTLSGTDGLEVKFPDGSGYQRAKLVLSW
ncbi:amylo-alpha-1,6-glucosidase [Edaphobacter bradus]|uniref:amylo-alpha-1,6-glucosidase n=1 Tax=Edaphobacter bradus TaxID=2259016 RepID=UPI0021E0B210|nr:amylo-alpha-1,6-glucosidase [Edaphobacter bradus]